MRNHGEADRLVLENIIEHCMDIQHSLDRFGNTFSIFQNDVDFRKSVCLSLMQIGELSGNLSEEFRTQTAKQMPWPAIKSMRNWIAHNYLHVKLEIIWQTVQEEIPAMCHFCEQALLEMPAAEITDAEIQL